MTAEDLGQLHKGEKVKCWWIGTQKNGWIIGWREGIAGAYVMIPSMVLVQTIEDEGRSRASVSGDLTFHWTHFTGGVNFIEVTAQVVDLVYDSFIYQTPKTRPHKCTRCSAPALVLFRGVECSNQKCPNYVD
jgi:hypothetical protein